MKSASAKTASGLAAKDTFETSEETIAGRAVTRLAPSADAAAADTTYRALSDDIVYYINADPGSLEAAVAALP